MPPQSRGHFMRFSNVSPVTLAHVFLRCKVVGNVLNPVNVRGRLWSEALINWVHYHRHRKLVGTFRGVPP